MSLPLEGEETLKCRCVCRPGPPCGKVYIVSDDHGHTHKCDFSVSDRKYTFRANLVRNLVPRLIQICRIQWWCSIFLFYTENTIFYCLCNRTGVETLKHGFFILLRCVRPFRGLFLSTVLKFFK